jgi:hypothetical protein
MNMNLSFFLTTVWLTVQSFHDTSSGSEDSCVVIMDSSHGTQDPELETNSSCAEVGVESTTLGKHQGRTEEIAAASPRNSVVRSDEPVVGEGSKDSGALIRQPVTTFSRRRFVESESSDSSPVTRPTPLTPVGLFVCFSLSLSPWVLVSGPF